MAINPAIPLVTVNVGQFLDQSGAPDWSGTVRFTPAAERRHVPSGDVLTATPVDCQITAGAGTVQLVASDAPDMTRTNVQYRVSWNLVARDGTHPDPGYPRQIFLPAANPVVDLELVQRPAAAAPGTIAFPVGVQSVAGLSGSVGAAALRSALGVPTYADGSPATLTPRPVFVDLRDHGGFGDGSLATQAFTDARTAAGAGGVVRVGPGLHLLPGFVFTLPGQRWEILGEIRAVSGSSPAAVLDIAASGVSLVGMGAAAVNGMRSTQSSTGLDGTKGLGIRAKGVSGVTVEGLLVVDCPGEGILIDAATDVRVARTKVTNCAPAGNRKAILVYAATGGCSDILFEHVRVDSSVSGAGGIGAAAKAAAVARWRVEHCVATIGGGTGASPGADTLGIEAWTQDPAAYPITDVRVTDSDVECSATTNQGFGVSFGGVVRGVMAGNNVRNCQKVSLENIGQSITCSENVAEASGYVSVASAYAGQVARNITVQGNSTSGSTWWALEVNGGAAGVQDCLITGNKLSGTYMSWAGTTAGVTWSNNSFKGTQGGLIQQSGSAHSGWKVDGNTIDITGVTGADGIILAGGGDGDIDHNKIKGGRHCIYGWQATDDVRIRGNTLRGAAIDGIRAESTMTNWTIAGANDIRGCAGYGVRLIGPPTGFAVGNNRVSGNTAGQVNTNGATLVALV